MARHGKLTTYLHHGSHALGITGTLTIFLGASRSKDKHHRPGWSPKFVQRKRKKNKERTPVTGAQDAQDSMTMQQTDRPHRELRRRGTFIIEREAPFTRPLSTEPSRWTIREREGRRFVRPTVSLSLSSSSSKDRSAAWYLGIDDIGSNNISRPSNCRLFSLGIPHANKKPQKNNNKKPVNS
ncbi:hypothetical protein LY78DRAFT_371626 [Colletotrichum sublineola]|nr:hypothetical protein LY78DRAFT_371626 [Colletotrichum sublineola]